MIANLALVLFNLIPAFPMDGGRIFRSLLALKLRYVMATAIATRTSQFCAVAFGLLGLFSGQLLMLLVALFIYFAARSENRMVQQHRSSVPKDSAKSTQPNSNSFRRTCENRFRKDGGVPSSLSIQSVAAWLANQRLDRCQIMESGRVIGEVTRSQLTTAIYRGLSRAPVRQLVTA